MGVAVCIHWELPVAIERQPAAAKKLMLHWTQVCKAFGVHQLYCVYCGEHCPPVGVDMSFRLLDSLDDLPTKPRVYVEQGGVTLRNFTHPADCIYIFGSDYGQLPRADFAIPSDLGLYADQACAIILHDRRVKRGSNQQPDDDSQL